MSNIRELPTDAIHRELDHLFRRQAGRITSSLARTLGSSRIDLAEAAVQEALLKALRIWPLQGVPEKPAEWLYFVAKNHALDELRRRGRFRELEPEISAWVDSEHEATESRTRARNEEEIRDDQLRMVFICCHPALPQESQVALVLKLVCGFGVSEIAHAFLSNEDTISQRILRAKKNISDLKLSFELPERSQLSERIHSVSQALYLLFNGGYAASEGVSLVRDDLCREAIRLVHLLVDHPACTRPELHALLALMYLHASRFKTRLDNEGNLLLLEKQDRSLWDRQLIRKGLEQLELAASGDELSEYHLLAGIAAAHAIARDFQSTPWTDIIFYYDQLMLVSPSPVVALNRAVAIALHHGPEQGLAEVAKLEKLSRLQSYYLWPATVAELSARAGDRETAEKNFNLALGLVKNEPQARFLRNRLHELRGETHGKGF